MPRRGWVVHQIKNPETTAEHIFIDEWDEKDEK